MSEYMAYNFQFGAPLGWKPRSSVEWNGYFLPYHIRISDMVQCYETDEPVPDDPPLKSTQTFELNIFSLERRTWPSLVAIMDFYSCKNVIVKQEKGVLVNNCLYFYRDDAVPSDEMIDELRELCLIKHAFGR